MGGGLLHMGKAKPDLIDGVLALEMTFTLGPLEDGLQPLPKAARGLDPGCPDWLKHLENVVAAYGLDRLACEFQIGVKPQAVDPCVGVLLVLPLGQQRGMNGLCRLLEGYEVARRLGCRRPCRGLPFRVRVSPCPRHLAQIN